MPNKLIGFLGVFGLVMLGALPLRAEALPGTGFVITGEGAPIVDMSVPVEELPRGEDGVQQTRAEICRSVAVMRGSDTVYAADYVGEVDVYGRAVAGADLPGHEPVEIAPEKIEIAVRYDVLKAIGIENYDHLDILGHLGTMTVFKTGRVFFDGRELTQDFQSICDDNSQ